MQRIGAVFTCCWIGGAAATEEHIAVSVLTAARAELQPRLKVTFEDCVLVQRFSRPMVCDGAQVDQIIERRVDLREIAEIDVSNAVRDGSFSVLFRLDVPGPARWTILRDQLLYGEEEAFERYIAAQAKALRDMAPRTGRSFSTCDGTLKPPAPRSTASLILARRPDAWSDFAAAARMCGVLQITDTFVDESP